MISRCFVRNILCIDVFLVFFFFFVREGELHAQILHHLYPKSKVYFYLNGLLCAK